MDQVEAACRNILLVEPGSTDIPRLVELLQQLGTVQTVSGLSPALEQLEKSHFDLVVSACEDFLAAERASVSPQLSAVLDAIGQGIGIVDLNGHVLWSNARFRALPGEVVERIRRHCHESYRPTEQGTVASRLRALSLVTEEDRYFEATTTPIRNERRNLTHIVVVVADVTRSRLLQRKVDAMDNAGRELVRLDADQLEKMQVRQRLDLLENKIIRYTRELLHFDNFAIRLVDKNTNKLELVLCSGLTPEAQQIDMYVSTEHSGISGYVAATGRSYICPDITKDSKYLVGIDNARSSLTVPLRLHDHIIGVFNIESDKLAAFTEEDRQFAEIFGRYIAIALNILDLLIVERSTTTGRLANNVSTEIAGPLGDILADASTLMEDYIGHDDLRHRLQSIMDNVANIKETIKQFAQPVGGLLGKKPEQPQVDPVLAGKSVLVIDDEEIIRLTVREVLSKHGCEVETARDGGEALAMLNLRQYDLVLSDIRMPGHSGYDIFRVVKTQRPKCPVIFMTGFGYDPHHSIIRAQPEGLAAVLYKPFKVDQLLTEVRTAVSASKS